MPTQINRFRPARFIENIERHVDEGKRMSFRRALSTYTALWLKHGNDGVRSGPLSPGLRAMNQAAIDIHELCPGLSKEAWINIQLHAEALQRSITRAGTSPKATQTKAA